MNDPVNWERFWSVVLALVCWIMLFYWLLVVTAPEDYEDDTSPSQPVDNSDIW